MVETNARYHIRVNPLTIDPPEGKYKRFRTKGKLLEFSSHKDDVSNINNVIINHNSFLN